LIDAGYSSSQDAPVRKHLQHAKPLHRNTGKLKLYHLFIRNPKVIESNSFKTMSTMDISHLYQAILDHMSEAVFVRDGHCNIVYMNRAAERISGWTLQEIQHQPRPCHEIFGDEDLMGRKENPSKESSDTSRPFDHYVTKLKTRSGHILDVRLSHTTLSEEGKDFGTLCVFNEISEPSHTSKLEREVTCREHLETDLRETRERFRAAYHNASVGMSICDLTGRLKDVNNALCSILGYSERELLEKDFQALTHPEDLPGNLDRIRRLVEHGDSPQIFEKRYIRNDGATVWAQVGLSVLRNQRGIPTHLLAVVQDMTQRKRAEVELQFFKHLIARTNDPIYWLSPEQGFRFIYVNEAACRHYGYRKEELLNMSIPDWDPNFPLEACERFWEDLQAQRSIVFETQHQRRNGETVPVEVTANYVIYDGKEFIAGTIKDITVRKQAARERAERELLVTLTLNTGPGCIKRVAASGDILQMNAAGLAFIEVEKEEYILGRSVFDVVSPEHRHAFQEMHRAVLSGTDQILQFEAIGLKGTRRWMETYAVPFQNPTTNQIEHLAVTHDITDRKRAEEALQRSEEQFRALYEDMPSMYFTVAKDGTVLSVNRFGADQLGYQSDELIGKSVYGVFSAHDKEAVENMLADAFDKPDHLFTWELRKVKKNGEIIWVREQVRVLRTTAEIPIALIACQDITTQKQAQEEYRSLVNTIDGIVWEADPKTFRFTYVSAHAERMLGYPIDQWVHEPSFWIDHMHPYDREWIPLFFLDAAQDKRDHQTEYRMFAKDGRIVWIRAMISLVKVHNEVVSLRGIMIDITEKKKAENALQQMNFALAYAMPGISQIDNSGNYLYVNDHYATLLGMKPEELIGQSWEVTVHHDDLPIAQQAYKTMLQTGKGEFEARGIRKDGSIFYKHALMVKADFQHDNRRLSHHCFMRDITERKEVEAAIQNSERSIRKLYEITSSQEKTFEEKMRALLKLGCERLNLPIGALTKREGEFLELKYLYCPDQSLTEHMLVSICESFCGMVLERSTPLFFEDGARSIWRTSTAYKKLGLEAYLGTKVTVGERVFGSLCFLDRKPYPGQFTESDIDFLQLMARWIGGELERKQAEDALQEANDRLQVLSQRLINIQETERRQLAHDLHDEIGQTLTAVKLNLQTIQQQGLLPGVPGILRDSMQILDHMLKHVRELSLDLRPSMLDDLGLASAVRWFVHRQAERAGWVLTLHIGEDLPPLSGDQAIASFRVIQEALTNVMRHAQANHVQVALQVSNEKFEILITDDGTGFDSISMMEQSAAGRGFGLLSMQERVRFLKGQLHITSQPGKGAQVHVRIPLKILANDSQV
jgi:PAS domain S-box-containing protein